MALIECPECNRENNDNVDTCVYCGYNLKNNEDSNQVLDEKISNVPFSKNEVKITLNNEIHFGKMELYDNKINIFYENKKIEIYFKDIENNECEDLKIKIVLKNNTLIYIETTDYKDINSFIKLQRNENSVINYKDDKYYKKKNFYIGFATGFGIIFFYNFAFLDINVIFYGALFGLIVGFCAMLVNGHSVGKKDRASGICPYCHKELILTYTSGGVKTDILENMVGKLTCGFCNNSIGVKYNHLYQINYQNSNEFIISNEEISKEINNTNIEKDSQSVEKTPELESLEKLKSLLDKELITQEEFDNKKKEILNKL